MDIVIHQISVGGVSIDLVAGTASGDAAGDVLIDIEGFVLLRRLPVHECGRRVAVGPDHQFTSPKEYYPKYSTMVGAPDASSCCRSPLQNIGASKTNAVSAGIDRPKAASAGPGRHRHHRWRAPVWLSRGPTFRLPWPLRRPWRSAGPARFPVRPRPGPRQRAPGRPSRLWQHRPRRGPRRQRRQPSGG